MHHLAHEYDMEETWTPHNQQLRAFQLWGKLFSCVFVWSQMLLTCFFYTHHLMCHFTLCHQTWWSHLKAIKVLHRCIRCKCMFMYSKAKGSYLAHGCKYRPIKVDSWASTLQSLFSFQIQYANTEPKYCVIAIRITYFTLRFYTSV